MPESRVDRRWRLRVPRRPSLALVVAVVAIVVSVAGNAAAAIIISSNSQVATHTIAGANAPNGDHKNLIAGSVGTSDLHAGAVTAAKTSAADRVHKIYVFNTGMGSHTTTFAVDELSMRVNCVATGSGVTITPVFRSTVNGDENWSYIQDDNGTLSDVANGEAMSANTDTVPLGSPGAPAGTYVRREGQVVFSNASRVITFTFHLIVAPGLNGLCELTGTAVPASMK